MGILQYIIEHLQIGGFRNNVHYKHYESENQRSILDKMAAGL